MGFWKTVGKTLGSMIIDSYESSVNTTKRNKEMVEKYHERAKNYSDEVLIKKFKNSKGAEQLGYGLELQKRGYGPKSF